MPKKGKGKLVHRKRNRIARTNFVAKGNQNAIFINPPRLKYLNLGYLLPNRIRIKMPYFDYVNANTSSGTNFTELLFRANSCFDPLYSGGTRNLQSPLFDALTKMYNRYKVHSASCTVAVNSSSATFQGKVCLHANVSATADSVTYADVPYQLFSQPNTKIGYIRASGAGSTTCVSMYRKTSALFPFYKGEKDLTALVSADPVAPWYYHVTLWDMNNDVSTGTVVSSVDVKIIQDVEWGDIAENTDT